MSSCTTHGVPFKVVPAGVSKTTGKPYQSFMACPERGCRMKPDAATTPVAKFEQSLDMSAGVSAAAKKDDHIARQTIAKALIGAGCKWNLETAKEAQNWLNFVNNKVMPVSPTPSTWDAVPKAVREEEIDIESIPF